MIACAVIAIVKTRVIDQPLICLSGNLSLALMTMKLSKFQGRGIEIDRVNSIRVAISMIFFGILFAIAP